MKKILIAALALTGAMAADAQVKQGTVIYEMKVNMHKRLPPEAEQFKAMVPEFQTTKTQLQFNATQSLYKIVPPEENEMPTTMTTMSDGGGPRRMNFGRMAGSPNDETFRDYEKELITECRELGPKKYLIDDTLRPLKWKMESDTMTINGYLCYKASTTTSSFGMGGMRFGGGGQRPAGDSARGQRTGGDSARRGGGGGPRNNMPETQKVVAWFTQDIETSAGPESYYGLPGLILKVEVDEGTIVYKALSIDTQSKLNVKAPTSGKQITREEYRKMMQQQFQGMRPPGGGGGGGGQRVIIAQ
ncbi:MAG TPA: GLPGLI family protein [Phnomibacter sp.]|nr:GLPGLI family protein [Phnomibacter sp.]